MLLMLGKLQSEPQSGGNLLKWQKIVTLTLILMLMLNLTPKLDIFRQCHMMAQAQPLQLSDIHRKCFPYWPILITLCQFYAKISKGISAEIIPVSKR